MRVMIQLYHTVLNLLYHPKLYTAWSSDIPTPNSRCGAKSRLSEAHQCPPMPPPTPLPYRATSCLAGHTGRPLVSASSHTCAGTQSPGTHVPGSSRCTGASPLPSTWSGPGWCSHSTGCAGGCCRCSGPCVPCRPRQANHGGRRIRGIWLFEVDSVAWLASVGSLSR